MLGDRQAAFPYSGTLREKLRSLLRYAVYAPSTHNTQPWIFKLSEDAVEVYADRGRALTHLDPDRREMTMSIGAAIDHLRLAMVC
ncbi:MAG TPA: nitroreductase family protein, partial [Fimbriimonas sp.]